MWQKLHWAPKSIFGFPWDRLGLSETIFLGQKLWLSGCDSTALCQHPEPTDRVWLGKDAIEPGVSKSGLQGAHWHYKISQC